MVSTKELIENRKSTYKFLLRASSIDKDPSLYTLLQEYLIENERTLTARSVDVSKLKYNVSQSLLAFNSFVGLFWFNDEYTKIMDFCGVKEFTLSDVRAKLKVEPDGSHHDRKSKTSEFPRGRVSLIDGDVVINVGTKCPDSALKLVIEFFGLYDYKDVLRVGKGVHWDPK